MALVASGTDLGSIRKQLQKEIYRCNKWARDTGVEFSGAKSQLLYLHKGKKNKSPNKIFINRHQIAESPYVKYLGLDVDDKLNWQ